MSAKPTSRRLTVTDIRKKKGQERVVCLTAYTASVAWRVDEVVDLILVGDSLGMVLYGLETTVGVTVEMMINHGAAVVRSSRRTLVCVDLPFGSYQEGPIQAFHTAARIMKETGCQAVKLEGGKEMAETVRFLTERGVPVFGHVGLMPQMVNAVGGFRKRNDGERILEDAKAIAEAGAFAMVVEHTTPEIAREVTAAVDVPTIGIGAGPHCDGQILVTEDMTGLSAKTPPFVKRYAEAGDAIRDAVTAYAEEVRAGRFP
ncbi:3-methyl-2-oxobutanoate hydroxymethyltransferase [Roseospirillum parvum]|uniref:3-methyl-2-oxobutanoate hydroxymethyltransferase n=1 Tax=Roseospirillum parvum TaxID=83401 RepID=A0A1G7Z7S3_9PROT|nr:3-methyl-2-oxobutanoate hydroxymethyltransferase [Roseospirillum parvum]SDH04657.1 3-methyl-2-oxobutanoate hydroxymethyltransferase [Roseospirillum parvum]